MQAMDIQVGILREILGAMETLNSAKQLMAKYLDECNARKNEKEAEYAVHAIIAIGRKFLIEEERYAQQCKIFNVLAEIATMDTRKGGSNE
jgi:hypothetical protein